MTKEDQSHQARWDARYAQSELVWSAAPNAQFAQMVANLTPGKALDVACGEGRNALWLAEQGWQVTAIDFSAVAIDKAKQIAARRQVEVEWLVGDVSQFPLPVGVYDLVAVIFLHTDPATRSCWLPKVLDAVKPGGTFLYIGHDPSNISQGVGGPQDPQFLPSASELVQAMSAFDVLSAGVIERTVASDPGHVSPGDSQGGSVALDTRVQAVRR